MLAKECTECRVVKSIGMFDKHINGKHGCVAKCKECRRKISRERWARNRDKYNAYQREYKGKDKERWRRIHREHVWKYQGVVNRDGSKFTHSDYEAMLVVQEHKCGLCLEPASNFDKALFVDHSHERGHPRALLCSLCNFAIGQFKEKPELLRKAADYLERHAK